MATIDSKTFALLRGELEEYEKVRTNVFDLSRAAVTLSKQVIYSQQRKDPNTAKATLKKLQEQHKKLMQEVSKRPDLLGHQSVRVAGQELVEAAAYLAVENAQPIPSAKDLGVDALTYLLGMADLSGELVRSAILASIEGNAGRVKELRDTIQALYGELIAIDNRESDLRHKIDKVGYDLEKIENIMLDLMLKQPR